MKQKRIGAEKEAAFLRVIAPLYAHTPKSGMGAARQGGRFNRPGQEALYLSTDAATALDEYKQDNPWLAPGTICTFFVRGLNVADLSAGFDPKDWDPLWASYDVDWRHEWFNRKVEPLTWYMSDDVLDAGLDGILFPSQARPGGINLVLYSSSLLPDNQLEAFDPNGDLRQLAARATSKHTP